MTLIWVLKTLWKTFPADMPRVPGYVLFLRHKQCDMENCKNGVNWTRVIVIVILACLLAKLLFGSVVSGVLFAATVVMAAAAAAWLYKSGVVSELWHKLRNKWSR